MCQTQGMGSQDCCVPHPRAVCILHCVTTASAVPEGAGRCAAAVGPAARGAAACTDFAGGTGEGHAAAPPVAAQVLSSADPQPAASPGSGPPPQPGGGRGAPSCRSTPAPGRSLAARRRAGAGIGATRPKFAPAALAAAEGVIAQPEVVSLTSDDLCWRRHAFRRSFLGLLVHNRDAISKSSPTPISSSIAAQLGASPQPAAAHVLKPAFPAEPRKCRRGDAEKCGRIGAVDQNGIVSVPELRSAHRALSASAASLATRRLAT